MDMRDTIGLVATGLGLLVVGAMTHVFQLWSFLGNYTVPWFCCAVALALLLVLLVSLLTGISPGKLPLSRVFAVILGSSVAIGLGMLVDGISYGILADRTSSVAEWGGFTLILVVVFWIPRVTREANAKQGH